MVELNREYLVGKYGKEELFNLTEIELWGIRMHEKDRITKIDSNTFKNLNKLKILWLGDNKIEEIDVRLFESLSNLKCLNLENNKLKRIDSNTFKNLNKLKILWLGDNEIEEIDVRLFESLSNLNWLFLDNNRLKRIDSNTFKGLTKLEKLWLHENEIEEIDVRLFESLSNLKYLLLSNNKLKIIDSNTFTNLTKLEELSLSNNVIEEIDVRLFESLSNLNWLFLDNNRLKRIDSNTFKGLTKLEKLWLHENEIEEIDVRLFDTLSNLIELWLHNNKLKEIDRKLFESLKSIELIILYENVGLNVLSYIKPSVSKCFYDYDKIEKYGSISEWNEFLQQFPEIANQLEQENANKPSLSSNQSTNKDFKQNTKKERVIQFANPFKGIFLNDRYQVVKKIGKGSFGLVYLVDDIKIDLEKVKKKAMKIMDKLDPATENELKLFSEINHENIVKYYDHFHMSIEGEHQTFLITEYCENGDLRNKIKEAQNQKLNFDDRQILDWMIQSTNALKYLHSKKPNPIIHRDIKPENMLLNERDEIKLADLGISKLMENTYAKTYAGTPLYMSPEVLESQYYPNTDVWSLGCVLYELKFLSVAFPQVQRNDPTIPTEVSTSGLFSSVLPKMLEKDFIVRINSKDLYDELEKL